MIMGRCPKLSWTRKGLLHDNFVPTPFSYSSNTLQIQYPLHNHTPTILFYLIQIITPIKYQILSWSKYELIATPI